MIKETPQMILDYLKNQVSKASVIYQDTSRESIHVPEALSYHVLEEFYLNCRIKVRMILDLDLADSQALVLEVRKVLNVLEVCPVFMLVLKRYENQPKEVQAGIDKLMAEYDYTDVTTTQGKKTFSKRVKKTKPRATAETDVTGTTSLFGGS